MGVNSILFRRTGPNVQQGLPTASPGWLGSGWLAGRGAVEGCVEVVVADAQLRQSLVFVRGLGRRGHVVGAVECAEAQPVPTFASRYLAATARVPERDVDPDALIDGLLGLADGCVPGAVLVPSHDGTIAAIEARRSEVERRYVVALAGSSALQAANDKTTTLSAAASLGIAVPRAVTVTEARDVPAAVAEVGLPAVVKPVRSWVVRDGVRRRLAPCGVTSAADAQRELGAMLEAGTSVLLQEWIPGARIAVSFVRVDGAFHGEFAQVAHRMLPILGGTSVMRESISVPEEEGKAARRLVDELDLDGYAEVEFRRGARGEPVLMEINPRLSASVEVAVRAGVDFPGLVVKWARGEKLGPPRDVYRTGVRMRLLNADVKWLIDNQRLRGQPDTVSTRRAYADFCKDFLHRTGYDYFSATDLRPAGVALAADARWATHAVTSRLKHTRSSNDH